MTGRTRNRSHSRRRDARRILRRLTGNDASLRRAIAVASEHLRIAEDVHAARESSGWSVAQLARRVRTPTSAIARIEAADFTRQSIGLLTRVAQALGLRLEIRFVDAGRRARRA